jgi:hypothetical protein
MITLAQPKEPYELDLPYGVKVTVKPLTTATMAACQAAARRRLEALETQARERRETGLPLDGLPDLTDEEERDGLFHDLLVKELAARHVVAWQGVMVADGDGDAPLSRENVAALMELFPVGDRFYQEFTLKQVLLTAAKNACGPSAAGTSSRAEGRNTAKDAAGKVSPAPDEPVDPMETAAPIAKTPS